MIVGGRPIMEDHKVTTIDEDALRREVAALMKFFVEDYDQVVEFRKRALPFMLNAHRKVWSANIDVPSRFIGRAR